jgi:hypothetical protein
VLTCEQKQKPIEKQNERERHNTSVELFIHADKPVHYPGKEVVHKKFFRN